MKNIFSNQLRLINYYVTAKKLIKSFSRAHNIFENKDQSMDKKVIKEKIKCLSDQLNGLKVDNGKNSSKKIVWI